MLVIGIAGGSGSGKTTVVNAITEKLKEKVVVIPQDSYYKDSSHLPLEERQQINFDHPDAIDFKLLCEQLKELKNLHHLLPVKDRDRHGRAGGSHNHRRDSRVHLQGVKRADGHQDIR